MANPFGGFVHTSPLSSSPHDPVVTLASNCIRDYFGPSVQTVADCLQSRGGYSTLSQLVSAIRGKCSRVWNEERERLVNQLGKHKLHRARGPATAGYVVEIESIRTALLILVQHSLVHVNVSRETSPPLYRLDIHRVRLLLRYPRFVEYIKKALDETAAALVEELLTHGCMRTVDAVVATVNHLHDLESQPGTSKSDRYTTRQAVVESFRRLVEGGFIELVHPLKTAAYDDDDEEAEFDEEEKPKKKAKRSNESDIVHYDAGDDPAVVSLLKQAQYRNVLPRNMVWRVSVDMFHDSIRAFCLGRLVAERFGQKVQSAGSMITAALKLAAHKEHALRKQNVEEHTVFAPNEIVNYLPKPVQQSLEKKPGGILKNLSRAFQEICRLAHPPLLSEVEDSAAHAAGGKFEVVTRELVNHLRDKIYHQVVLDSHGEVAARICSILNTNGHLEAEAIAETAMVPAKDTREILHQLYRANYITLFTLQQSKQHNPANMIYLWTVSKPRMQQTVTDNICQALTNLRLRRQHEVEVGKDWIERAKEAAVTDVNEPELDKENYNKFCRGLERLDNACLQLDETLMVLLDF